MVSELEFVPFNIGEDVLVISAWRGVLFKFSYELV